MEGLTANVIYENMLSQADSEGHHYQDLNEISNHTVDGGELKRSDRFIRVIVMNLHTKKTTRGWQLEVGWKDGTLIWIPLKDIKNSNPVELAYYAVVNNIEDEHDFKWQVKDVLCKPDQIISKYR